MFYVVSVKDIIKKTLCTNALKSRRAMWNLFLGKMGFEMKEL